MAVGRHPPGASKPGKAAKSKRARAADAGEPGESTEALRARLQEAEQLIDAIRRGEVDALVQTDSGAESVTSLEGAEDAYRHTVETMLEGALTLATDGTVLYCNARFAELLATPAEQIIGTPLQDHVAGADLAGLEQLIAAACETTARSRLVLRRADGSGVAVLLALRRVDAGHASTLVATATDLSELEGAQAQRDHLARIVETAQDGIIGLALDGTITSWNQGAAALYGYTAEQVIGQHEDLLAPPELKGETDALIERLRAGEPIQQHETRRLTRRGKIVELELTLSLVTDTAGQVIGVSKVARDIGPQRRAQRERDESERRFHSLLDNVQLIAVMVDSQGRITYCNDYFLKLTGWAGNEVLGGSYVDLFIPPEVRDDVRQIVAGLLDSDSAVQHNENEILTRSGARRLIRWDNTPLYGTDGAAIGVAAVGADITDHRRASEALKSSELRLRKLIENVSDVIAICDSDGTLRFVSASIESIGGYHPKEVVGRKFFEFLHPEDRAAALEEMQVLLTQAGQTVQAQRRYRHKQGDWRVMDHVASNQIDTPGIEGVVVTLHDVTALRQTAWALGERVKEQRCLYRIAQLAADIDLGETELLAEVPAVLMAAFQYPDATIVRVQFGAECFETPGFRPTPWLLASDLSVAGLVEGRLDVCYQREFPAAAEGPFLVEERELLDSVARTLGQALATRRAQQSLVRSEQQYRLLFESSHDAIVLAWAPDWRVASANPAAVAMFRADCAQALLGCTALDLSPAMQPDGTASEQRAGQLIDQALRDGAAEFEWTHRRLDGESFPVAILLSRVENDGQLGVQATIRDISARKQQERQLQRVNRALKTLSAGNSDVVRAESEEQLLQAMCRTIVQVGGYPMAWVGYAQQDESRSVRPMAWAGNGDDYVQQAKVSWADGKRGRGPCGRTIRSGKPTLVHDIANDHSFAPWREAALAQGYRACVALPLSKPDEVFGALLIYSGDSEAFDADELQLLEELADDLGYGVNALRTHHAHERGLLQLARSLDATVAALARTVELRDPYTAGHQRRVAEIAGQIAVEMGLPAERIAGLKMAAGIHDIGKVSVPSEILSKPARLSEIEYELVKGHAQAGYELLQGIDFPWPVADIVRQHHERIDGTGYPQGLSGEQILLEAKILAVADVIEAVSAHRPYRPGRGLEEALSVISEERGTHFDPAIVDCCLQMFREDGFTLPT